MPKLLELTDEEWRELKNLVSMQLQASKIVLREVATEPEPPATDFKKRVSMLKGLDEKLRWL